MVLIVHFPYDDYFHEREDEGFRSVVVCGADFEWTDRPDLKIEVLKITWRYSK